ncbi:glutathione S-transferase N-terminal domain-containing protein [Stenotrophomonas sp. BIGb0135]|uniref:glutathione S-transferase family protein n=1 Tax=Stenotrophomonas sp. BIGb0135 TaxID=2940620 RepID=UPI002167C875|nr:glutathione S-transferase N-terminal domain-containing protein [Stenotrophomonas sp. BIGb0135]MCS4235855.1 glutathione S-transferase [Stenotrophomonas sp. BIGb0135]
MLELYGKPTSINVRKVLWVLAELGLEYRHDAAGASADAAADARLRRLNPNAQVPVLCDGDFVLWESNSICRYLAARAERADLLPQAPRERARVEQWMDWQATDLNSAWRYAFMAGVRRHPDYQDDAAAAASQAHWNRLMGVLDRQLAQTGAHVAGERFSLADIVLGLSTQRWRMTPGDKPVLPCVDAWFARLRPRAGFALHVDNGVP